jgi:hypothetical protein
MSKQTLLFDKSPDSDQDSVKKKKAGRKKAAAAEQPPPEVVRTVPMPTRYGFLEPCVDEARCPRCGCPSDVDEVFTDQRGVAMWRMVCGWSCGLLWQTEQPRELRQEVDRPELYRVRSGRYPEMTFRDLWDSGFGWYVEYVAENGDSQDSAMAKRFLAENR